MRKEKTEQTDACPFWKMRHDGDKAERDSLPLHRWCKVVCCRRRDQRQANVHRTFAFHGFKSLTTAIKNARLQKQSGVFWQRMRDSNPRKRSQSPVCYRYTNPLYGGDNRTRTCDLMRVKQARGFTSSKETL